MLLNWFPYCYGLTIYERRSYDSLRNCDISLCLHMFYLSSRDMKGNGVSYTNLGSTPFSALKYPKTKKPEPQTFRNYLSQYSINT